MKYRTAIVGCGQIMKHHIHSWKKIKAYNTNNEEEEEEGFDLEIVALCDPNNKNRHEILRELTMTNEEEEDVSSSSSSLVSTNNDLKEYDTMQELLHNNNDDNVVDLVFLSVPHDLHESLAMEAIKAGKHVIMEKPLAPTIEACQRLLQAAMDANTLFIISEQSPYWQEVIMAKEELQNNNNNNIGTVISATSYYYESMRDNVTSGLDSNGNLGWRCSLQRSGGGIVIDGGLHWIRPLRETCGDVKSVMAVTRKNVQPGLRMEGESLAHAILEMTSSQQQPEGSGPLYATFHANMMHTAPMAHDSCPYFRWTGTKGELVIPGNGLNPNGGGGLILYNDQHPNGKPLIPIEDRQGGFFLGFQGVWERMLTILKQNDRNAAIQTVSEAAKDVATALAIYQSSANRQWTMVNNSTFDIISSKD